MRILLTALLVIYAGLTSANTTCKKATSLREIDIVYSNPGYKLPCEVTYQKSESSEINILWRAKNQPGYCEEQAEDFIEKFEGLGWICESEPKALKPQKIRN